MSIKKKLGLALATTALGATLVGAGTFAIFTDSATNTSNTFSAGTLDINVGSESAWTTSITNIAPGDTGSQTFTVTNDGSLDLKYDVADSIAAVSGLDSLVLGETDASGASTDLSIILERETATGVWTPVTTSGTNWVQLPSGQSHNYRITYTLPLNADDSYQGGGNSYQVTFYAEQLRNNP